MSTQVQMKELKKLIADVELRLKEYSVYVNDRLDALQESVDSPIHWIEGTGPVPAWGLEIVEALIEALNGVRLQGAQKYAVALGAKYFPPEEVVEEEVSTDTVDTTITA